LLGDDDHYHIENSTLRENARGRDALDCIAAAKWAWKTAILAAGILKTDAARSATWQERLDKIVPYYRMPDGTYGSILARKSEGEPGVLQQHKEWNHFPIDITDEFNLCSPPEERERAFRSTGGFPGNLEHLLAIAPNEWQGLGWGSPHPWLYYQARKACGSEVTGTNGVRENAK
jgi:hypothetical protein